ncbi:MAG: diguanylate cyclase [Bdellovibrionota bacterium]
MKKLIDQIDVDWNLFDKKRNAEDEITVSEEQATLLYVIDAYNKHLIETDGQPVRKVREALDEFSKAIVGSEGEELEKVLFKFRQYFATHRIEEYTYVQKTFNDFKGIIWDFADQLGDDLKHERVRERELKVHLDGLREAVESDAIDALRATSREFIDTYIQYQSEKDDRRMKRMTHVKKNLTSVKKQLSEAHQTLRTDHLTGALNRKSFEEQAAKVQTMLEMAKVPACLIMLDIDHFKKVNDTFGHHVGDSVLKNCVKLLKEIFNRPEDTVARIGGEEFAVILSDMTIEHACQIAEQGMERIRAESLTQGNRDIKFTVSMGVSQLKETETIEDWMKRTDQALYTSKNTGRDRVTVASEFPANKLSA